MSDRILTLFGEEMFPDQSKPGGKGRGKKKAAEQKEETAAEALPQQETEEVSATGVPLIVFEEPHTTVSIPVTETFATTEETPEPEQATVITEENKQEDRPAAVQEVVDVVYHDDTFYSDIRPEEEEQQPEVFWKQFFISEEATAVAEEIAVPEQSTLPQSEYTEGENTIDTETTLTAVLVESPATVEVISFGFQPGDEIPVAVDNVPDIASAEKEQPGISAEDTGLADKETEQAEEEQKSFIIQATVEEENFAFSEPRHEPQTKPIESYATDHQEEEYTEEEETEIEDYEELYRKDQDELTESSLHITDDELEHEIADIEQELRTAAGDEAFSGAEQEIRYIAEDDIPVAEQLVSAEETEQANGPATNLEDDIPTAMQTAIAAIEEIIIASDGQEEISADTTTEAVAVEEGNEEVGEGIDNAIATVEAIILAAEIVSDDLAGESPAPQADAGEQPAAPKPEKIKQEETEQANLPADWKGEKNYYSIGEVADLFKVKTSHIRFWTNEFKLKVRTTRKGDRLYTPDQVREIRTIYHLVKERGFTLAGAKARLKSQNKKDMETIDLKDSLIQLRNKLVAIKNQLGAGKKK